MHLNAQSDPNFSDPGRQRDCYEPWLQLPPVFLGFPLDAAVRLWPMAMIRLLRLTVAQTAVRSKRMQIIESLI